jgi:threonine dehydratase
MDPDSILDGIDVHAAAARLAGVVRRTPLVPFPVDDTRVEVRLKLESQQETGSFKARGAWNQVSTLDARARAAGVCATSSGNHGKALAWAARRAGVPATIFMPADAYPNKVQACRDELARVDLAPTREEAERRCAALVRAGATLVHPYDAERTIEGAGTVGLEIAEDWPEVELVLVPTGGGGLLAGTTVALRRALGEDVLILGVEPEGAPTMTRGIEEGQPTDVSPITSAVQGLCPLRAGARNIALVAELGNGMILLSDEAIFAGQRALVRAGHVVEPAGAAALAAVLAGELFPEIFEGRRAGARLRVACVVSGGNPDPAQLETVRRA